MVRSIEDMTMRELMLEIQKRSGSSVIFVRQKTNIQTDKYLLGCSGDPVEITKLMMLGSDHIINRLDEEEDDDDPTDGWGHPDSPDGSSV
tara:strand:+ start:704 stop:973 length:270 start_codon:yes stop_codon:yes gene_type:complete